MSAGAAFWPNGARLAVTVSMQFEAGGQPTSGAPGPGTEPIRPGYPDLPQNSFYDYLLEPEAERQWILASVDAIERATGQRPRGYNCYWMRGSVHTLELLQQLGFTYHIDDLSADEPFTQRLPGGPLVTVPYTVHMNDIASFDFAQFAPHDYEQQLMDEFEQLYEEGASRRRMMSLSLHDRISGHASRVRALDRFFSAVGQRRDVWWARRDQIADWALATPQLTPMIERQPAEDSGLPGYSRTPLRGVNQPAEDVLPS